MDAAGRSLVIGRAANLRRWAASRLGAGRPPRPGRRPPTDLSAVAAVVRHAVTSSAFHQRLVYERLAARHVPLSVRRDLRPPVYLHLDAAERFPRLSVRSSSSHEAGLFGPFRDRRSAERGLAAIHKRMPLRPCDYDFEPAPDLPLGLGCLYAQVRSCAAPCLERISEPDYRALAQRAAAWLGTPAAREAALDAVPAWVQTARPGLALVVESGRGGIELYPVRAGAVLEEAAQVAARDALEAALARLAWPPVPAGRDDAAWLCAWLGTPRRSGAFLVVEDPPRAARLAESLRALPRVVP